MRLVGRFNDRELEVAENLDGDRELYVKLGVPASGTLVSVYLTATEVLQLRDHLTGILGDKVHGDEDKALTAESLATALKITGSRNEIGLSIAHALFRLAETLEKS